MAAFFSSMLSIFLCKSKRSNQNDTGIALSYEQVCNFSKWLRGAIKMITDRIMKKKSRQNFILDRLQVSNKVQTPQLALDLDVSEDTIRRDLNEMSLKGLLTKVHGGAVASIQQLYYYNDNVVKHTEEKNMIAQKAISLLQDGMSIIITDGTTNLSFARHIPKDFRGTVFTYCLPIAMELTALAHAEIILFGGKVQKHTMVTLGNDVSEKFSQVRADLCFIGTGNIDVDSGISEDSYEVSLIKRKIVASSDGVVSLTTSAKLGTRQTHLVCSPHEIDFLITELDPAHSLLSPYRTWKTSFL